MDLLSILSAAMSCYHLRAHHRISEPRVCPWIGWHLAAAPDEGPILTATLDSDLSPIPFIPMHVCPEPPCDSNFFLFEQADGIGAGRDGEPASDHTFRVALGGVASTASVRVHDLEDHRGFGDGNALRNRGCAGARLLPCYSLVTPARRELSILGTELLVIVGYSTATAVCIAVACGETGYNPPEH